MSLDVELVRKLMARHGWSQKELAGMAGVTDAAMSRYLKGCRQPRAESRQDLRLLRRLVRHARHRHGHAVAEQKL